MYAKLYVGRDDEGADIEGGTLTGGDPFLFHRNQSLQGIQHVVGVQAGDTETVVGIVHSLDIPIGTEELNASVGGAVRLQPLEHFLGIVEHHAGRIHGQILIRNDTGVMPALSLMVVHHKHMIGEIFSEAQMIPIGLCFSLAYQLIFDIQHP